MACPGPMDSLLRLSGPGGGIAQHSIEISNWSLTDENTNDL